MKATLKTADRTARAQKKRVLLVVRWPVGGIRTFMRYVYRRFDPDFYFFSILVPEYAEIDVIADDLQGLDLEIIKVSKNPTSSELFWAVAGLLSRGRFDLIHSHGFTSGICAALPAFLFRTPHILTSHDVLGPAQFKGVSGWVKKCVMKFAFSLVDTIHSVSNDAQANLFEFFPSFARKEGKCIVISNGIESERFLNADKRDLRGELEVGEDVFLVGFLGRFMSQKGFLYLVDAIEQLKEIESPTRRPLVVAFGEGGFVREEKAALAARGLGEHFRFLPFTANVAGVIKGLDLVVMPSLWEACPLLPMETLTCGTPLISTDCVGLREVVQGTPTLVVPTRNSTALAEGIRKCMEQDQRQRFVEYAPIAADRYDVAATAIALDQLIRNSMDSLWCNADGVPV